MARPNAIDIAFCLYKRILSTHTIFKNDEESYQTIIIIWTGYVWWKQKSSLYYLHLDFSWRGKQFFSRGFYYVRIYFIQKTFNDGVTEHTIFSDLSQAE